MCMKQKIENVIFAGSDEDYPNEGLSESRINQLLNFINPDNRELTCNILARTTIWNWVHCLDEKKLPSDKKKSLLAIKKKSDALVKEIEKHHIEDFPTLTFGSTNFSEIKELEQARKSATELRNVCENFIAGQGGYNGYYEFVYQASLLYEYISPTKFTIRNDSPNNSLETEGEKFIEIMTMIILKKEHEWLQSDYNMHIDEQNPSDHPPEPTMRKIPSTNIKTACRYAHSRIQKLRTKN